VQKTESSSPYECFAVVSRSKLDGAVSVENEVQKIVRSLDVNGSACAPAKDDGHAIRCGAIRG